VWGATVPGLWIDQQPVVGQVGRRHDVLNVRVALGTNVCPGCAGQSFGWVSAKTPARPGAIVSGERALVGGNAKGSAGGAVFSTTMSKV